MTEKKIKFTGTGNPMSDDDFKKLKERVKKTNQIIKQDSKINARILKLEFNS